MYYNIIFLIIIIILVFMFLYNYKMYEFMNNHNINNYILNKSLIGPINSNSVILPGGKIKKPSTKEFINLYNDVNIKNNDSINDDNFCYVNKQNILSCNGSSNIKNFLNSRFDILSFDNNNTILSKHNNKFCIPKNNNIFCNNDASNIDEFYKNNNILLNSKNNYIVIDGKKFFLV